MPDQPILLVPEIRSVLTELHECCEGAESLGQINWDNVKLLFGKLLQQFGPLLLSLLIGLLTPPKVVPADA